MNVYQLPVEQLEGLKDQLDNDVRSLGTAYDGLYNGRTRYLDNVDAIAQYKEVCEETRKMKTEDAAARQEVLVCMTSSLFVRGYVVPSERVIVDVGTGYYLEQSMDHAGTYFTNRAVQIKESMNQVEKNIVLKQRQQNQVLDALQSKLTAMQQQQQQQSQE